MIAWLHAHPWFTPLWSGLWIGYAIGWALGTINSMRHTRRILRELSAIWRLP